MAPPRSAGSQRSQIHRRASRAASAGAPTNSTVCVDRRRACHIGVAPATCDLSVGTCTRRCGATRPRRRCVPSEWLMAEPIGSCRTGYAVSEIIPTAWPTFTGAARYPGPHGSPPSVGPSAPTAGRTSQPSGMTSTRLASQPRDPVAVAVRTCLPIDAAVYRSRPSAATGVAGDICGGSAISGMNAVIAVCIAWLWP